MNIAIYSKLLLDPRSSGVKTFMRELLSSWLTRHPDEIRLTMVTRSAEETSHLREVLPSGPWKAVEIDFPQRRTMMGWLVGYGSLTPTIGRHDLYLSGVHWPLGKRDRPFVGIIHDLAPVAAEASWDYKRGTILNWAYRRLFVYSLKACCRRAAAMVSVSQCTLDDLKRRVRPPLPPHRVIHHGTDTARWSAPVSESKMLQIRRECGVPAGARYVLGVGRHAGHKNFFGLVRAFHRHVVSSQPDVYLVLVGEHQQRTLQMQDYVREHNIEERLRMPGLIPDDQLPGLMQGANVFAFPSFYEGFGLPILEAYAAGTPVVCSNASCLPEVAGDAALLVDPRDTAALGSALNEMLADENLRGQVISKGRARARVASWDTCADAYLDFFRETLGIDGESEA